MIRKLLTCCLLVIFFSTSVVGNLAWAQSLPAEVVITAKRLNVRDDIGGSKLGAVLRGQQFQLKGTKENWGKIEFEPGRLGWISLQYTKSVTRRKKTSNARAARRLSPEIELGEKSDSRHALIIGNSSYQHAGVLKNPIKDAKAVGSTLQQLGFEVTILTDADQRQMERSIKNFGKQLRKHNGVGLFYYAGHGIQFDQENYLLPVEIDYDTEDDVRYDAVPLGKILSQMKAAGNSLNVVVLDACRNNPFARSFRSSSRGLAQVVAPTGTFISYATAPGSVAADGDGENGLFTAKLLKHMTTPGLSLEKVFKQVRVDVQRESGNRQVPWDSSSVTGDFYFMPIVAAPSTPNTLDLGDLEELAAEEERKRREQQQIKARWANWQQQMQSDYEKVTAFEQRKISNDLKIDSWQLFLKNWSDDNPYSQQDRELRSMAESRVLHWQQAPQGMTLYFHKADEARIKDFSAFSKSENWKTTRTSGEDLVYVGAVQFGLPNGQGTYTFPDGEKYVGECKNGKVHGQGTWTHPDGRKYVGEWKDGKLHGQGTYTFADGRVWSGLWKDNEFLGRK